MESISLIDTSKYWIYNKNIKKDNKWRHMKKFAIVRVYPRFVSILECVSNNSVDFCFLDLLLYKPFYDIEVDIGVDSITIVSNWKSYVPWHVEQRMDVENSDRNSKS